MSKRKVRGGPWSTHFVDTASYYSLIHRRRFSLARRTLHKTCVKKQALQITVLNDQIIYLHQPAARKWKQSGFEYKVNYLFSCFFYAYEKSGYMSVFPAFFFVGISKCFPVFPIYCTKLQLWKSWTWKSMTCLLIFKYSFVIPVLQVIRNRFVINSKSPGERVQKIITQINAINLIKHFILF